MHGKSDFQTYPIDPGFQSGIRLTNVNVPYDESEPEVEETFSRKTDRRTYRLYLKQQAQSKQSQRKASALG